MLINQITINSCFKSIRISASTRLLRGGIRSLSGLSLITIFLLLLPYLTFSQQDTIHLKEVEVLGIKPEISTSSPNPVQQISLKKLNAIPSASVAEAIRNFSGVVIKDFGGVGGLKTVMIRSLGSNHTGVFVDGQPGSDAATGQIDLGKISLQDISNIRLSVGQPEFKLKPASIYAYASVLEIDSKEVDFSNNRNVINLSAKAGSYSTFNPTIRFDSKLTNRLTTGITLNYYKTKGNFPFVIHNGASTTEQNRENSDIETLNARFVSKIIFGDSSTMKIRGSWYYSNRGLPGAVILYNPYSSQRLENKDFKAAIQFENNHKASIRRQSGIGFSGTSLIYTDPDFQNQSGGLRNVYDQVEYYISEVVAIPLFSRLNFSLATDLLVNKLKTNAYSISEPSRITSLTAGVLQYENKGLEIQGSLLMTLAGDFSEGNGNKNYFRLSPAISLIRALTHDHALKMRFMYKNIYRMPSFNDLYYTIAGNNKLRPEIASMADLGILFSKALNNNTGLNLKVDGFINKVTDKIVTVPTHNLFIWSTQNIGKVDIKGLEFYAELVKHLNQRWSVNLSGNYTYQHAVDITDKNKDTYNHQIAYIPFETSGGLATVYYQNLGIGINTLFNGYRYSTGYNTHENLLESWISTDLTASWLKKINDREFRIKAEVVNIMNQQYEVVRGFPMTGRAYYINLYVTL